MTESPETRRFNHWDVRFWGKRVLNIISLGAVCFAIWLLLSGYFSPLLLSFGAASCVFVVLIAHRMDVVDREGLPLHLGWRLVPYWIWLIVEIIKANVDVAKRILDPALPISPTMVDLQSTQRTDVGKVIYANSITLTPGTVATAVGDNNIQVHALTRDAADSLLEGEMDRRVTALEGVN